MRFAVNVIRREIDGACMCEGQVQFELSELHVQCVLRQADSVAKIVVLQLAIAQCRHWHRRSGGNIIVDPEGQVLPKASRGDDREGIRRKQGQCAVRIRFAR